MNNIPAYLVRVINIVGLTQSNSRIKLIINNLTAKMICTGIILSLATGITPKDAESHARFEIGAEGEVPTSIRYGNTTPGFSSNTLYLGIPLGNYDETHSSLIFSFNTTVYALGNISGEQGSVRGYGIITGWWPINPLTWLMTFSSGDDYINLLSPAAGYSYSMTISDSFAIDVIANAGPAYSRMNKPDMNAWESTDGDNLKKLRAYEKMHGFDNKFGCRLNFKLKLEWIVSESSRLGFIAGYTHYIFIENHFNSYDLGTFVSFMF